MANEPDDPSDTKRDTPKSGSDRPAPATKAAARKAAATAKVDGKPPAAPTRPTARKIDPNRKVVPPKGAEAAKAAARSGDPKKKAAAAESSRYTPPVPSSMKVSPWYVPAIMFGLLGLGMLVIIINYLHWPFGDPSNVRLLIGLGCILGGILAATRYQ